MKFKWQYLEAVRILQDRLVITSSAESNICKTYAFSLSSVQNEFLKNMTAETETKTVSIVYS